MKNKIEKPVSIDDDGGVVMLTLSDGKGHSFKQSLDISDAAKILELQLLGKGHSLNEYTRYICQGDLEVRYVGGYSERLMFLWNNGNGGLNTTNIKYPETLVLNEALKSYCRMLMKSKETLP